MIDSNVSEKTKADYKHKTLVAYVLMYMDYVGDGKNTKQILGKEFIERVMFMYDDKKNYVVIEYMEYIKDDKHGVSLYDYMVWYEQKYSMFGEQ